MDKSRLFVGSSVESLDVAYAVQENLEHDAEVVVWTQGIFELSKYTLETLLYELKTFDFSAFVLSSDDVSKIRDKNVTTPRDNVIFELGLSIGMLGRERSFVIMPRDVESLHLPTDLLGISPAQYTLNHDNLLAALGPACNKLRMAMRKVGKFSVDEKEESVIDPAQYCENDLISILESWIGSRHIDANTSVIRFSAVDSELGLPKGAAEQFLETAASKWGYAVARKGKRTILLETTNSRWQF